MNDLGPRTVHRMLDGTVLGADPFVVEHEKWCLASMYCTRSFISRELLRVALKLSSGIYTEEFYPPRSPNSFAQASNDSNPFLLTLGRMLSKLLAKSPI